MTTYIVGKAIRVRRDFNQIETRVSFSTTVTALNIFSAHIIVFISFTFIYHGDTMYALLYGMIVEVALSVRLSVLFSGPKQKTYVAHTLLACVDKQK